MKSVTSRIIKGSKVITGIIERRKMLFQIKFSDE